MESMAGAIEEESWFDFSLEEITSNIITDESWRAFYPHDSGFCVPPDHWDLGRVETVQTEGEDSTNGKQTLRDFTNFFWPSEEPGMDYCMDSLASTSPFLESQQSPAWRSIGTFNSILSADSGYSSAPSSSYGSSRTYKRKQLPRRFSCKLCNTTLSSLSSLVRHRRSKHHKQLELSSKSLVQDVEVSKVQTKVNRDPAMEIEFDVIGRNAVRCCKATTAPPNILTNDKPDTRKDDVLQCQLADPMVPPDAYDGKNQEHEIRESEPSASRIDSWIQDATQAGSRDSTHRDDRFSDLHTSKQLPIYTPSVFYSGVASLRTLSEDEMSVYESQSPSCGVDLIDELATIIFQLQTLREASCPSESLCGSTLDFAAKDGSEESGSHSTPCTDESSPTDMTKRASSDFNGTQLTSESDTSRPRKRNGRENALAILASTLEAQEAIQMPCPFDKCFGTNSTISELLVRLRDRHHIVICHRCCEIVPLIAGEKPAGAQDRHKREYCPLRCVGASCAPAGTAPNPHLATERCSEPWAALRNEVRWRFIHRLIQPDRPVPEADFERGPEFQHSTEKKLSRRQPVASRGQVILNQLRTQILQLETSENSLKRQLSLVEGDIGKLERDAAEVKAKTETDHARQIETLQLEHAKAIKLLENEQTHKIKNSRRIVEAMVHLNPNIPPFIRNWIEEEFPGFFGAKAVDTSQNISLPEDAMLDYGFYTNSFGEKD